VRGTGGSSTRPLDDQMKRELWGRLSTTEPRGKRHYERRVKNPLADHGYIYNRSHNPFTRPSVLFLPVLVRRPFSLLDQAPDEPPPSSSPYEKEKRIDPLSDPIPRTCFFERVPATHTHTPKPPPNKHTHIYTPVYEPRERCTSSENKKEKIHTHTKGGGRDVWLRVG
jgi:hypothetical protein